MAMNLVVVEGTGEVVGRRVSDAVNRAPEAIGTLPRVRLTGILVEDGHVLVQRQVLKERAHWNFPGGALEPGETLGECLRREMREECGLEVEVGELLYVCDRFRSLGRQTVDMSFLVRRVGGGLLEGPHVDGQGEYFAAARMVPVDDLPRYGFSDKLVHLVRDGFPHRGTYQGDFHEFYG